MRPGLRSYGGVQHNGSMFPDEPLTQPTEVSLPGGEAIAVRHAGVTMDDLRPLFDAGFAALAASGAEVNGPGLAVYRGDPTARFDIDLVFPVAGMVEAQPPVEPYRLPAGRAIGFSHLGGYDALPAAWARVFAAAHERGLTGGDYLEVYVTEPTPDGDPAALRTDLFLMV